MIVRRSRVSASAPAINDSMKNGSAPAVCTSATWSGEGAIVVISHEAPTVWIMPPNEDTSEANQNSANARCPNGASVARRQRSKYDDEAASAGADIRNCHVHLFASPVSACGSGSRSVAPI
jgi:hypothetical protein